MTIQQNEGDLNFDNLLLELSEIHGLLPDLRFGEVLQNAIDEHRRRQNCDLCQLSSKVLLEALRGFKERHARQRQATFVKRKGFGRNVVEFEKKLRGD